MRTLMLLAISAFMIGGVAQGAPVRKVECQVTKATSGGFGPISFVAFNAGTIGYVRMDGYDTFNNEDRFFVKGPIQADPTYRPRTMTQYDRYRIPSEWNIIELVAPKMLDRIRALDFSAYVRIEADGGVRDNVSLKCHFVK